jgi:chromosome segregation ATPase
MSVSSMMTQERRRGREAEQPKVSRSRNGSKAPASSRNQRLLSAELQAERRHAAQLEARLRLAQSTLRQVLQDVDRHRDGDPSEGIETALPTPVEEQSTAEAAMLRQALEQVEEQRVSVIELRTALAAAETHIEALTAEVTARRQERAAGASAVAEGEGTAPQRDLQHLLASLRGLIGDDDDARRLLDGCGEAVSNIDRRLQATGELKAMLDSAARELAERDRRIDELLKDTASVGSQTDGTTPVDAEGGGDDAPLVARLRDTDATLQQSLEELEEQRVLAVELRTVLAATEHRIGGLAKELAARDRALVSLREKAKAERKRWQQAAAGSVEQRDVANQAAAESRTMLLAMESRMRTLEEALAARERERDTLRLQVVREREAAKARRGDIRDHAGQSHVLAQRAQGEMRSLRRRVQRLEEKTAAYEHGNAALRIHVARQRSFSEDGRRKLAEANDECTRLRNACAAAERSQRALRAAHTDTQARLEHALAAGRAESRRLRAELQEAMAAVTSAETRQSQAENERAGLRQQLQDAGTERERMRCGLEEAERRHQQASGSVAELRTVLEVERQRLKSLQEDLANRERDLASVRDAASQERAEEARLQERLSELEAEQSSAEERDKARAGEIRDLMSRCRDFSAQLSEAQAREQRMQTELSALQRLRADESPELERLRGEVSTLAKERHALEQKLAASARRCEEVCEELQSAEEKANVLERQTGELQSARADLKQLHGRVAESERCLQSALQRNETQIAEANELTERCGALASQLAEAQGREEQAQRDRDELLAQLTAREHENERLETELLEAGEARQQLQTTVATLEAAVGEARQQEDSLQAQSRDLAARCKVLKAELLEHDERAQTAADEAHALRAQVARMTEDERRAAAAAEESRRSEEVLERELREARQLLEEQQGNVTDLQERCAQEGAESARLREQLAAAGQASEENEAHIAALRRDLAASQEHEKTLAARVEEQTTMLEGATAAVAELRQELDRLARAKADDETVETSSDTESPSTQDAVAPKSEEGGDPEADSLGLQETEVTESAQELHAAPIPMHNGSLSLVHVEDDVSLRDALRGVIDGAEHVRYCNAREAEDDPVPKGSLVAANLLASGIDPLHLLASSKASEGRAFLYCSAGGKGRLVGLVDYFPYPFEPEACAARLLEGGEGVSRLLAVSEDIEAMHALRALLGRARCSTTVALDARQALDLIELVNPDVVLIDMSLPRGEGLELLARLRTEAATAGIHVAFLWTRAHEHNEARRRVPRLFGSGSFVAGELTAAIEALVFPEAPPAEVQ